MADALRVHGGDVKIAVLRLQEFTALPLHGQEKPLNAHGKAQGRLMLPPQLLNEPIISAAAAHCALGADVGGDKLKHSLGVVIQSPDNLGIDAEIDAHIPQIAL